MQVPDVQGVERGAIRSAVVLRAYDRRGHTFGRSPRAVEVSRQQPVADQIDRHFCRVEEELHRTRVGVADDHLLFLQRIHADAVLAGRPEIARRQQVGVRPDPVLRVVRKEWTAEKA